MAQAVAHEKSLFTIICFGDSLTAGLSESEAAEDLTPYGNTLRELIGKKFNLKSNEYRVIIAGQSGQCAIYMKKRLENTLDKYCNNHNDNSNILVIILGGTNDMVFVPKDELISNALCNLHTLCHSIYSVSTVVVTVPQMKTKRIKKFRNFVKSIKFVNAKLLEYANKHSLKLSDEQKSNAAATTDKGNMSEKQDEGDDKDVKQSDENPNAKNDEMASESKKENFEIMNADNKEHNDKENNEQDKQGGVYTVFDFYHKLPYHQLSEQEVKQLWCEDGVHLTQKGYSRLAQLIFIEIEPWCKHHCSCD